MAMHSPAWQLESEHSYVTRCRKGDTEALARLRETSHAGLMNILLARGATRTEADDLLADLWADCVPGAEDRPSLLEKFSGKCALQGWLATVVTRRWIDLKRSQARRGQTAVPALDRDAENPLEHLPAAPSSEMEDALVNLLRDSLQAAFARCSAEALVLLHLSYLHGLAQRELVMMMGCHESKISRTLKAVMEQIEADTLEEIKKRDPWLQLTWRDFIDLCETRQIGFL